MRASAEIKAGLVKALGAIADEQLARYGFLRKPRSIEYTRKIGVDTQHVISFSGDYRPKYRPGAELHLYPNMVLRMPAVTQMALKFLGGDKLLLAGAPDMIVNQPAEFTAPKEHREQWYATGQAEIESVVTACVSFLERWVIPFLDGIVKEEDLIKVYETSDDRMMKQRHWYVYIAAAMALAGSRPNGLSVLERHLAAPLLRKRYSAAFSALGSG